MDWYARYCRENGIPRKFGRSAERHKERIRKNIAKAESLESVDLSAYGTRQEAEDALFKKATAMGLTSTIFWAIVSWLIRKLLDGHFGEENDG